MDVQPLSVYLHMHLVLLTACLPYDISLIQQIDGP